METGYRKRNTKLQLGQRRSPKEGYVGVVCQNMQPLKIVQEIAGRESPNTRPTCEALGAWLGLHFGSIGMKVTPLWVSLFSRALLVCGFKRKPRGKPKPFWGVQILNKRHPKER